jgi:hypothetical protein
MSKIKELFLISTNILAALLLLSCPAFSQTSCTPITGSAWCTLVPAAAQAADLSIAMPVGTVYRFGSTTTNTFCTATATAAVTVSDWTGGFPSDCDPDVQKEFDIQQTTSVQTVTVLTSGTPQTVTIPALVPPPPAAYPPIAFTPETAYGFTVTVASGTTPLAVGLTIQYGTVSVTFTCTPPAVNLTTGTLASSCVPNPLPVPVAAAPSN